MLLNQLNFANSAESSWFNIIETNTLVVGNNVWCVSFNYRSKENFQKRIVFLLKTSDFVHTKYHFSIPRHRPTGLKGLNKSLRKRRDRSSICRLKRSVILNISNPEKSNQRSRGRRHSRGVVYRGGGGWRGVGWRRLGCRLIVGRPGFLASTVLLICFLATRFLRSGRKIAGLSALRETRKSFRVLKSEDSAIDQAYLA